MGAGPVLNANSPGSLKLRSSATAYLVEEKSISVIHGISICLLFVSK
jgi:hypothetical protein